MKKTAALVTLVCFLVFSCSCVFHRWEKVQLESVKPEKKMAAKISAVQLQFGEHIDFSKQRPAQIVGESVVGNKIGYENISIPFKDIKFIWIRQVDMALTLLVDIGAAVAIGFGAWYLAWAIAMEPIEHIIGQLAYSLPK